MLNGIKKCEQVSIVGVVTFLGTRQFPRKLTDMAKVLRGNFCSKGAPMAVFNASVLRARVAFSDKNELIIALASAVLLFRLLLWESTIGWISYSRQEVV